MHTHSHRSHPKPIRKQNQKAMYKCKRKYHQTKKTPIIQLSLFNIDLLPSTVANEAALNCGFYTQWYLHIPE